MPALQNSKGKKEKNQAAHDWPRALTEGHLAIAVQQRHFLYLSSVSIIHHHPPVQFLHA